MRLPDVQELVARMWTRGPVVGRRDYQAGHRIHRSVLIHTSAEHGDRLTASAGSQIGAARIGNSFQLGEGSAVQSGEGEERTRIGDVCIVGPGVTVLPGTVMKELVWIEGQPGADGTTANLEISGSFGANTVLYEGASARDSETGSGVRLERGATIVNTKLGNSTFVGEGTTLQGVETEERVEFGAGLIVRINPEWPRGKYESNGATITFGQGAIPAGTKITFAGGRTVVHSPDRTFSPDLASRGKPPPDPDSATRNEQRALPADAVAKLEGIRGVPPVNVALESPLASAPNLDAGAQGYAIDPVEIESMPGFSTVSPGDLGIPGFSPPNIDLPLDSSLSVITEDLLPPPVRMDGLESARLNTAPLQPPPVASASEARSEAPDQMPDWVPSAGTAAVVVAVVGVVFLLIPGGQGIGVGLEGVAAGLFATTRAKPPVNPDHFA